MDQKRVFLKLGVEIPDNSLMARLNQKVAAMICEAREEGIKAGLTMSGGNAAMKIIERQIEWREKMIAAIRCEIDAAQNNEHTSEALKRLQAVAES